MLIDQQAALDSACAALDAGGVIALDTEFARTETYAARLCLLQLCGNGGVWCVDELAALETKALWQLLCGGGLRVIHSAKQDIEVIWQKYGCMPAPLFDTQIGAGLLGHPAQLGYAALVKALLDVDIDKTHTRADWSRRPLAPELLAYAATDVLHLPVIHEKLRSELEARGRYGWALEDSARLLEPEQYRVDPGDAWQRLSGLARMPVPVQVRARQLAKWREAYAISADRPRQWILSDRALLDIAIRNPADVDALAHCADLAPGVARRQGSTLLAELATANEELARGSVLVQESRPEAVDADHLKRLGKLVEEAGKELGIAPEILATRKDITTMMRGATDARPLSGWRREVIGLRLAAAC
jgi:ribonuclease D